MKTDCIGSWYALENAMLARIDSCKTTISPRIYMRSPSNGKFIHIQILVRRTCNVYHRRKFYNTYCYISLFCPFPGLPCIFRETFQLFSHYYVVFCAHAMRNCDRQTKRENLYTILKIKSVWTNFTSLFVTQHSRAWKKENHISLAIVFTWNTFYQW